MKSINKLHVIPFLMMLMTSNVSADSLTAGKSKAETCLGCHAIPGYNNVYPTYKVPKLAGQHAEYIISALKAYQNKDRVHANAIGLSEQDIKDIALYFESVK